MTEKEEKKIGKFLCLILRHKPEVIDMELDEFGYLDTKTLILKLEISLDDLKTIVKNDNKQRFSFSKNDSKIRTSQGHSIDVNLKLESTTPPNILYHGTASQNLSSIKEKGLIKGKRAYVHLSDNIDTAIDVGKRYAKNNTIVVIPIKTKEMCDDGNKFYLSENNVWLIEYIKPKYIKPDSFLFI